MKWRTVRDADLMECLRVQPLHLGDEIVGREPALAIWKGLIHRRVFASCVLECDGPEGRKQIAGFGSSVFVSAEFATSELTRMRPGLNSRLFAAMARGEPVVPGDAELCHGNEPGGLDLVVLGGNYLTKGVSPDEVRQAKMLLPSGFVEVYTGYHLNRILSETVSDGQREFHESSGVWRTIQRYSNQRALVTLTRQDAFSVSGSLAATLFNYEKPVLGLRDTEKELLAAALRGGTDEDLADRLHLSQASIKKRWHSLFDRVAETRPDLLPKMGDESISRGPQKRHHILFYVRSHPSEVRPFDWHGSE